ncbi:LOW QUALITY PROTEIN: PR domain zinc finger protein 8 [Homalodisca vitripennis]|uniref:LOW QUALITY PROTEIN: PR domain zinc finger protein 8 n=1 Tax=Homalodisca vitripennis TaxID=197043 RepID=UPI001EEB126E|nr:LOW QUALITY PROTEIN: PR domain zinc finger protein 8 [Homalodisca vitripennis]
MTMDIHQRSLRAETSPSFIPSMRPSPEKGSTNSSPSPITEIPSAPQKPAKRSFDVAFLMAPDDLTTKKRQQQQHQLRLVTSASLMPRYSPPEMTFANTAEAEELKISRSLNQQRLLSGRGNFGDFPSNPTSPLGLLIPSPKDFQKLDSDSKDSIIDITQEEQSLQFAKSAFTKVKSGKVDFGGAPNKSASPSSVSSTISGGEVSPDMSYQESLSPPMMNNSSRSPVHYLPPSKSLNPNMAYFATGGKGLPPVNSAQFFYGQPKEKQEGKPSSPMDPNGFLGNFMNKGATESMQKLRPMLYQGDNLPYSGIPVSAYPFPTNFPPAAGPVPTHTLLTAAASVTAALLPSSLAALTLPAQNVCAKCKISFRMTSDLVYHMRSHHKGEHVAVDAVRRRRDQDKLRCPVCNETFRERHHLTRHMTAHQDKEGDNDDDEDVLELSRRRGHQALLASQHK